ncbi:MAG: beta-ketoacyl-ACP synthase III [Christensenellales bacterium]|jgi:3-oxoacyl-[acyl-carrier-protein] synthase-3
MRIIGTGGAAPELIVTNDDLAAFLDTSDEWISTRTGISRRRVMSGESLEILGAKAAERAIEMSGLDISDIDYLICTNVINKYITPGLGCIIQGILGLDCPSVDLNGACAGFVYALQMANGLLATGCARNVLIVSAEANSQLCDWTDRSTCVLFGDAAGAVVVTGGGEVSFKMSSVPDKEVLYARNPPGNSPYSQKHEREYLHMNGQEVYKFAVSSAVRDIRELLEKSGMNPDDIGHYILHQANLRISESARKRLDQPAEKFPSNIGEYGNTSSASVPLLLDELNRQGKLLDGENIIMSAFGAGLVTGTCLLRWNKC